ncbi:MAG: NAD(P)H-binding protein [Cytophagia bacterium]|nr:NAD(P)H-binding protein [Cytophagia bacterium]
MSKKHIHAVTGAFGYSGKYIAQRLLNKGHEVITITNSVNRTNPFGDKLKAFPFNFDNSKKLVETLKGVSVLYITYWVRFNHKMFTHADAVRNTISLFEAAAKAGVERIVYVSITNPSEDSHLEYFSGKGKLEKILKDIGVSYAILRPAVLFGKEDILINNIAWALRRLPIIGVFGDGQYRIQPIYVDDLAEIAVQEGSNRENKTINCIGPETFTYKGLVDTIGKIIDKRRLIVPVPPLFGYIVGRIIGQIVNDQFITRDEIDGLMADLLYVDSPPTGKTKLTDWTRDHADTLGRHYSSELARRKDRSIEYKIN